MAVWSTVVTLPSLLHRAWPSSSFGMGNSVDVGTRLLKEDYQRSRYRGCSVTVVCVPHPSSTFVPQRASTTDSYRESFQLVLSLAALTSALSVALVLGVTRFVNGIRYSVIEAPRSLIEPEKEITKRALAVFATFSVALLSINTTSHSASDLAPVHVILIIPFVVDEVIVAIIPAIPSLLHTLHIWFRRLSTELKVISGLGNREACSPDDIGFAIVSIDRIPINVTGHFNDIFLGRHVSFGQVALRRPRISEGNYRDTMRRFQRETKTWRSLDHPCILPLLGTFTRDEHIYFVSPFAANGCLLEYLAAHPHVNCILLLCGIADAIAYLHKNGIVHGDIKAGNVLINGHGCPLVCDFGLAKMPYCKTSTERKGAGTVRWQSPEIWDNRPRSLASDTYAFAMTIAEILTRDVPFAHLHTEVAVIKAVLTCDERPLMTPQASPTGISYENCWSVAKSCWPTLPQDRISMAEAFQRLRTDPSLAVETSGMSSESEPDTNPENSTDLASDTSQ